MLHGLGQLCKEDFLAKMVKFLSRLCLRPVKVECLVFCKVKPHDFRPDVLRYSGFALWSVLGSWKMWPIEAGLPKKDVLSVLSIVTVKASGKFYDIVKLVSTLYSLVYHSFAKKR